MKLRKKLISLGLAVALTASPACSVLENFGVHVDMTTIEAAEISTEKALRDACKKGGTYTITGDIHVTSSIEVTKNVTLRNRSASNVIDTKSDDLYNIFKVSTGGHLTLGSSPTDTRVVVRGGEFRGGELKSQQGVPHVQTAPIVIDGGTVTINNAWVWCSKKVAIRVTGAGHLVMNGGEIKKVTNPVAGAVVLGANSDFKMTGGSIQECTTGGVMVGTGCTFNMSGGTITGNSGGAGDPSVTPNVMSGVKFTGYGGGVYNMGTFNMSGGTITGNSATQIGGGVYNIGTFNMSGGTISNNVKGGVYNTKSFTLSGGTLTGNSSDGNVGNGVYNKGSNVNMYLSGCPSVSDEVVAYGGSNLIINGALTSSVPIPVRVENPIKGGTVATVSISNGSTYASKLKVVNLPSGMALAGDGSKIVISSNITIQYDYDADGKPDGTLTLPYKSEHTVHTYAEVKAMSGAKDKSQYYDLDPTYMRLSDGKKIQYGAKINPTDSIMITAIWNPKKYTVTYDYNGGKDNYGQESHSVETNYDTGFTVDFAKVPTREGYDFVGWSTEKDASVVTYKEPVLEKNFYKDTTLYAVWKLAEVVITYDVGSGSAIESTVGNIENPPVVTNTSPEWDGYKFVGWYDAAGNKVEQGNAIMKNQTLTARWVENGYWDFVINQISSSKIAFTPQSDTISTTYTALNKPLTVKVEAFRKTSQYEIPANKYMYQIVAKGKTVQMKDSLWTPVTDGTITISDHSACRLYIRAVAYDGIEFSKMYESNGFSIDTKAPTVSGVKNGKIYKKAVKIRVSDAGSGVKKITLNGKKIKSGKTIKKNGVYKLVATDKSGHKKVLRFAIRK